ncbi:hypothetical protein Goarm_009161 [Gossypium armourianum]|uniref:Uncharacterized protein n=1 Tax=Gossypium armourianum TaxID=34283 RepID=A0A7J9JS00_9ROSI|nr:hypothetical protein [Gossypium armourianum]
MEWLENMAFISNVISLHSLEGSSLTPICQGSRLVSCLGP